MPVLFEEKMPVWMTILASIVAAGLTYYLAPSYNHRFQLEDVRNAHLQKTTDNLNQEIIDLSLKIRRFNFSRTSNDGSSVSLREDCLDSVTKIQWRLVDLRVLLTESDDEAAVTKLSNSLDGLKSALDHADGPSYGGGLDQAMGALAASTRDVLNRLYHRASLKA